MEKWTGICLSGLLGILVVSVVRPLVGSFMYMLASSAARSSGRDVGDWEHFRKILLQEMTDPWYIARVLLLGMVGYMILTSTFARRMLSVLALGVVLFPLWQCIRVGRSSSPFNVEAGYYICLEAILAACVIASSRLYSRYATSDIEGQ